MPEGHTIHRLARDLATELTGQRVAVSSPSGRFPESALLDGETIRATRAIGKHLLIDFDDDRSLHIHLGRFGKLRRHPLPHASPNPNARLRMTSAEATWELVGAIQCDLFDAAQVAELRTRVAGDPLAAATPPAASWKRIHATKRSIGALLLDQSIFAGIGNIYRAEILFMLGIDPLTPGSEIDKGTFTKIWKLARTLLKKGVESNRIITVEGATARSPRRKALHIYKKQRCPTCGGKVTKTTNGSRTLYYCPVCQRLPASKPKPKARRG